MTKLDVHQAAPASDTTAPFGILIVAHGALAEAYLATLQHVIGQQERIVAVSIEDKDDREIKQQEIAAITEDIDIGSGVVIVTDMFGGTPSNLATNMLPREGTHVLYGASMPALIKLARSRKKPVGEALELAVQAGKRYLNYCDNGRARKPGESP